MVNVGDNGYVTDIFTFCSHKMIFLSSLSFEWVTVRHTVEQSPELLIFMCYQQDYFAAKAFFKHDIILQMNLFLLLCVFFFNKLPEFSVYHIFARLQGVKIIFFIFADSGSK